MITIKHNSQVYFKYLKKKLLFYKNKNHKPTKYDQYLGMLYDLA